MKIRKAFARGRAAFYSFNAVNPYRLACCRDAWEQGFLAECEAFA